MTDEQKDSLVEAWVAAGYIPKAPLDLAGATAKWLEDNGLHLCRCSYGPHGDVR